MKKPLAIVTTTIAAALGLLLLAACANPFITPRERDNPAVEGRGLVRIETGAGPARTALPSAVFDHYEYSFSHDGTPVPAVAPVTAGGDVFELEPGDWTVTVEAYAGSDNGSLAATGSGSFLVILGEETEVVIKLSPIVSSGTGTLSYALTYPDGAVVGSFTLTRLADTEDIDLKAFAASSDSVSLTGTMTVPSGYYLARAVLQKDGVGTGKSEVVHIYNNLTTDLELRFVDDNFKATMVVSSADSGPGTLREALTSVMASDMEGATIRIDLPEGDRVITLWTVLPQITKSVVIEGNGATLTQSGFTASATSQLLYINSNTATVRINRLHFKSGRATNYGGAIRNAGRLTLESCVFSDNRTSDTSAYGGAVYTAGSSASLTLSGCTFYGNTAGTTGGRGGAVYVGSAATLTGNIFWGNSAAQGSVVYGAVTVTSGGYNVSDKESGTDNALGSGWEFKDTDKEISSLPVSPISFRPIGGGSAVNRVTTRPTGYPTVDFYGEAIPGTNAAAGAAQKATTGTGSFLDYGPIGPGAVSVTGGTVDGDGFASAAVTLTAQDGANGVFRHWIVDGAKHGEPSNALTLTVNKDTTARAVFYAVVTNTGNSGSGTLREALSGIGDGGGIILPEGQTITLNTPLPQITKSVVIEGNGATLTQSGFTISNSGPLLYINSSAAVVRISRLHFKGGRTGSNGAGIQNTGNLTLESCIFSDNKIIISPYSRYGGAIYTTGSLTVSGCAFYENSAGSSGGAIYGSTVTLTGNVFWGNTAGQHNVVYGSVNSGGFNVSDKADGSDTSSGSGWDFINGDKNTSSLPVSSVSFRPIGGRDAIGVITERPQDYPKVDFYGVTIPETSAASGATQTAVTGSGYFLDYAYQGPGAVSVTSGAVDGNGFASSSVTLTAQDGADGVFRYWIVDGAKHSEPSNTLTLTVNKDTTARAVFYTKVTGAGNSGPGSLREALISIGDGSGIVLPAGQTITLTSPLDQITKSIVIEGNGATLTQRGFTEGLYSQLLYINNNAAVVHISRLHFKGGRATGWGGAIYNSQGTLTLESCIFSDNKSGASGAIYNSGTLTVLGCTFYGNSAGNSGGAIYRNGGTVTLTGNVFWGNTAPQHNVVYGSVISGGFNVSDKADGLDAILGSGWNFEVTDVQPASLPISPVSFKPIAGGEALSVISAKPVDYPAVDFYGAPIPGTNAAAGAVQTAATGTGYYLDYGATGPGTVSAADLTMDADGLLSIGSVVTLTAQAGANGVFMHWTVDGLEAEEQTPPYQLDVTMDDHKTVRAVFYIPVTSVANSGQGSLREALAAVDAGSGIVLPAGQTIILTAPLPEITKGIVIDGNGATLTQSGFTESYFSQLLNINSNSVVVRISRLHFKGGRATNYGGAIYSYNYGGSLILESCIFSDNRISESNSLGGAIFDDTGSGTIISGCTFYGNKAGLNGGAIYKNDGTMILTGNVFLGNTAAQDNVVFSYGSVISGGFNVSDKADGSDATLGSGWTFEPTDRQTSLSISPFSFKPISGGDALGAITVKPTGYPAKDFYGVAIPEANAAAGAIQAATAGAGYLLDYAPTGPGTVSVNRIMNEDGLLNGVVTLTAQAGATGVFMRWIVNGEEAGSQSSLAVTMDGHKTVRAVFYIKVTDTGNTGPGTLREALTNAANGDGIFLPAGETITLTAPLPRIEKSLVIEGNGATLTQNGFGENNNSQLLYIFAYNKVVEVHISRLLFKGGRAYTNGGAIYNYGGILTLESCIFRDNRTSLTTATGGAISSNYAPASVIVSGCTFYENRAGLTGGAIYSASGSTVTLTGNIFLGNTAPQDSVASGSGILSGGFNVSDKASGAGSAGSGWTFTGADKQASFPISPLSFKPLSGGGALSVISSRPADYPKQDFRGTAIPGTNAAAGAIQTAAGTGYFLDYASIGPGTVTVGGTIDDDGLISSGSTVTLTALANTNRIFMHWIVNGEEAGEQSSLDVIMDGHKTVRAVFCIPVTSTGNDGQGSLREVLAAANDGDWILLPAGETITLTSPLPQITKGLIIEGNGATLTQIGFAESSANPLLYFNWNGVDVRISRLHFKGGRTSNNGAGIRNMGGNLTLESCIFSDNKAIGTYGGIGGAMYSNGNTTISGCTFYGNSATATNGTSQGGAVVYTVGTLTLTGNVFWENTADAGSVVFRYNNSGSVVSGGYNVSDKGTGTDNTAGSGWTFAGDTQLSGLSIDAESFKPFHASLPVIPLPLTGFPQQYFDGTLRGSSSAPGAMPAQPAQ